MSVGQSATFIIFNTPEEGIGIPLTLAGFRDGFAKLP
jgi:invasion protein IalB